MLIANYYCISQYQFLAEILKWRAQTMPDHTLFTLLNAKVTITVYSVEIIIPRRNPDV